MPFCSKCGTKLFDNAKFCHSCGALANSIPPQNTTMPPATPAPEQKAKATPISQYYIPRFEGLARSLILFERQINFTKEQDCFINYRNHFDEIAYDFSQSMCQIWATGFHVIDDYIDRYIPLWEYRLQPVYSCAVDLLIQYGIYDVSVEILKERAQAIGLPTPSRLLELNEFSKDLQQENAERVNQKYSERPTLFFEGVTGYFMAKAYNKVVNESARRDFENAARLSPAQRKELFTELSTTIENDTYSDVMVIGHITLSILKERGVHIGQPTPEAIKQGKAMMQNISSQSISPDRVGDVLKQVLEVSLDLSGFDQWVYANCPKSIEATQLLVYLKKYRNGTINI